MAVLGGVEAEGDVYPAGTFAGGVVEDELVEGEAARLEFVKGMEQEQEINKSESVATANNRRACAP